MDNSRVNKNQNWPFQAWLKIAVFQLGLTPTEFWTLPLTDWFALTQGGQSEAMNKDALLKLELDYEHSYTTSRHKSI